MLDESWHELISEFTIHQRIPFAEVPVLAGPHYTTGRAEILGGELFGVPTLIFMGRPHFYEGRGWTPVAFPVYLSKLLKVQNLLITDSAGGIGSEFKPGEIMAVRDHINFMGSNPLFGPYNDFWGQRYPEMNKIYDNQLRKLLKKAASNIGFTMQEGVLCAFSGPNYETPSEVSMAESFGADAVAMSIVPEAILGNACGIKVAGLCCISNFASGLGPIPFSHHSVFATIDDTLPKIKVLLENFVKLLRA